MLDHLIVGFGLSGSALAFQLEKRGRSFKVFDEGKINSSKVAGGMMNPVILKRFTLAWNADEQLEIARNFYSELEEKLGERFLQPVELYRRFSSAEEQNNWFQAADNKRLAPFLDTELKYDIAEALPAPHGFGRVRHTQRLDTQKFLGAYASYLGSQDLLETGAFNYEELVVTDHHVEYRGVKARNIIFCEGFGIKKNPFFGYLPLTGNKGEYIIIHAPELRLQTIVKSSVFISPAGNDNYVVGATYSNFDKTPEPTAEAREELETKLRKLISVPYEVIHQVAGIRPSTADRRPLVGRHPEHSNLFCCNGFGSRGVIIAPTAASYLLDLIEENKALPAEINLSRFTRKWFR